MERFVQFRMHVMRRREVKFSSLFIVFVNHTALRRGKLNRARDYGGQHRLQIQCRAHRLADIAERFQLLHQSGQLAGACLKLLIQTSSSSLIRFRFAARVPSSSRFGTSIRWEKSPEAISSNRASIC